LETTSNFEHDSPRSGQVRNYSFQIWSDLYSWEDHW